MNATTAPPDFALGLSAGAARAGNAAEDLLVREEPVLRRVIQRYVRDAASVDDVF
nr:hypothetical protein [Planctomycetota bacterium]